MHRKFKKLNEHGKKAIARIEDHAHSHSHMENVIKHAMEIAKAYPDVDLRVIESAAIWHDTGRLHGQENHEELSALMAHNEALKHGLPKNIARQIYDAIVYHKWSSCPKCIEGHIVRDADKLDFLDVKRWEKRIINKKYDELEYVADVLIKLRKKHLRLPISKKIFDKNLPNFLDFIDSIEDKKFNPIKKRILSTFRKHKKKTPDC